MRTATRWYHLANALTDVGVEGLDEDAFAAGALVLWTEHGSITITDTWNEKNAELWTGWDVAFYGDESREWASKRPEVVAGLVETIASGKLEAAS